MPAEQSNTSQLDPFAFPPETKGRFLMLMLAALAFGDSLGNILFFIVDGVSSLREIEVASVDLVNRWWRPYPLATSPAEMKAAAREMTSLLTEKFAPFVLKLLIVPGTVLLLFTCLAIFLYRDHNQRLKRRYTSKPLTRAEAPKVVADLESCAAASGLSLPSLEYSSGLVQGHAFGYKGKEVLILAGTPKTLENAWEKSCRPVALHELAHVANDDARDREKAKALWTAFAIFLLFGLVVLCGLRGLSWRAGGLTLKFAAMLLFVYVIWAGLIRIREYYADWRAVSWGVSSQLQRLLSLPEEEVGPWERWNWWWQAWSRWGDKAWWRLGGDIGTWCRHKARRLLRFHPSFTARLGMLKNPRKLFQISPDLSFLTGVLLTLVLGGALFFLVKISLLVFLVLGLLDVAILDRLGNLPVGTLRNVLLVGLNIGIEVLLFLAFSSALTGVSYLAVKTIGVQVQRRAVADLAGGVSRSWGYARLLGPAFLLAVGMEVGFLIAPFSLLVPGSPESWEALPIWLTGSTALMWLWLACAHGLSRMLLGSYVGAANPRLRRAVVTWASVGVLTVLFWPAALARVTVRLAPMLTSRAPLPMNINPQKFFIYGFFMTTLVLLMLAITVYLLGNLFALAALRIGPLRRRGRCPTCAEEVPYTLSLGRNCRSCGESLTPWIFTKNVLQSGLESEP